MRQRATWQKLKTFGSFCLIMLLLPYIVTVFVHGKDFESLGKKEEVYVNVKRPKAPSVLSQLESRSGTVETSAAENVSGAGNVGADRKAETEIVQVPWEEYFIGIMGKEISADAEMELLKAQAVLLRTKLYQELDAQEQKVLEEDYLTRRELEEKAGTSEADSYYENLLQAMRETENQVLLYQDTYALAPFHQSSNGRTRSAQEALGVDHCPYLAVRECPLDKEADDEMQISTFEYKDIQSKCQSFLVAVAEEEANKTIQFSDFEIISHDSAGYVQQMRIGETVCTGDQFRDALSLTSSAFSIKDTEGKLQITTMGKGHGIGLSQWTAQKMAKAGDSYEKILQFFFEGTTLADGGPVKEKLQPIEISEDSPAGSEK
nr:SpoIID/LytB domain-containing protein [uncultured Schaedlerella sp.]